MIVAVLAGAGRFPLAVITRARALGHRTVVVAHRHVTLPAVATAAHCASWVHVGELHRAAQLLGAAGAHRVIFAGGIPWSPLRVRPRLDRGAAPVLYGLARGDDTLLRAVAAAFEERHIEVVAPEGLLGDMVAPAGHLAGPALGPHQSRDLRAAREGARRLGARDQGQGTAARGARLWAEDRRGTDALLERVRRSDGRGGALVKLCKEGQDRRFDMPAIGPRTMAAAARARLDTVAIEAETTLIIDRDECCRVAEREGVSLLCLA